MDKGLRRGVWESPRIGSQERGVLSPRSSLGFFPHGGQDTLGRQMFTLS